MDDKKKHLIWSFIIALFLMAFVYVADKDKSKKRKEIESQLVELREEENTGSFAESEVCKAAIGFIMMKDYSIIESQNSADNIKVFYRRPSDGEYFEYKCKLDGRRVHWGNWEGRWRTHEMDSKIFFEVSGGRLKLQEYTLASDRFDTEASLTEVNFFKDDGYLKLEEESYYGGE